MVKENIRSKLNGNDLDLSLMSLEEIPVKEIAAIPKATNIDLSCNRITTIPQSFCNLKHIVKLDLGRNSIESLPKNFGDLSRLQSLDLFNNKLKTLPTSFSQLKQLKWLDLKGNPLSQQLKKIAGDCLDEKQCQTCARKVVQYMDILHNEMLLEKEKQQKREEELAAQKKIQEDKEQEQQRKAKKAAKEKKRAALQAEKQEKVKEMPATNHGTNSLKREQNGPSTKSNKKGKPVSNHGSRGCFGTIFKMLSLLFVVSLFSFGLLFLYTKGDFSEPSIRHALEDIQKDAIRLTVYLKELALKMYAWLQKEGKPIVDGIVSYGTTVFQDLWSILIRVWNHVLESGSVLVNNLKAT